MSFWLEVSEYARLAIRDRTDEYSAASSRNLTAFEWRAYAEASCPRITEECGDMRPQSKRTGTIQFFVSTPNGFTLNDLKVFDGVPGLDIKTEMAWEQGSAVQTEFSFGDNPELRPRGELLAPVPVEVWLFGSGVRGQCRLETQEGLTLSALCSTDSGPL